MTRQLRRALERELVSGLGRRRRLALVERLRGNAEARRSYDRALAGFRALEQREVSRFELDQVERWLFDDLEHEGATGAAPGAGQTRWTYLAAGAASLLSAAALLVWLDLGGEGTSGGLSNDDVAESDSDGFGARGKQAWSRPLALELVCGQPPRPAQRGGCRMDELLGFSARLGDEGLEPAAAAAFEGGPRSLTVFGLDAEGELLYYAPTPASAELPTLELGAGWTALPMSVRLEVNHEPGQVRVFALLSEREPSLAMLDSWARALADAPPATLDDPPWHLRLPAAALREVCPRAQRCASAETELELLPTD